MPEGMPQRRSSPPEYVPQNLGIEEVDDAREYIKELISQGVRPIVTVPLEYAEQVTQSGIRDVMKRDHRTGEEYSFVAGTIGMEPFLPEGADRLVFEVDTDNLYIEPRFTGKDKAFHGVIGFPSGIPARALKLKGTFNADTWEDKKKEPLHEEGAQTQ